MQIDKENKILLAYLFCSFANGKPHIRSDIDLAIYVNASEKEAIEITDEILMSTDREIEILRLNDEEESPFIIQQALKGIPLVEPHLDTLYNVAHKALHEAESIRFRLLSFLKGIIEYFQNKVNGVGKDIYYADKDIRYILDKCTNDIIFCIVDLCEEVLKKHNREIPDTYKENVLACYEFLGDIVYKIAPLTKHRNETIHQYLKINWQNIVTVKNKISEIESFYKIVGETLQN